MNEAEVESMLEEWRVCRKCKDVVILDEKEDVCLFCKKLLKRDYKLVNQ